MGRICKKTEEEKRANNRNSQRSFRERSKLMQQKNRERMDSLEAQNRDLSAGNEILQGENQALKSHIQTLEQTIQQLQLQPLASSPPDRSLARRDNAANLDPLTQDRHGSEPLNLEFDTNEQNHNAGPPSDGFDLFTPFPDLGQMRCEDFDAETSDPFRTGLSPGSHGTPLPDIWNVETDFGAGSAYNASNSNLELPVDSTCDTLATVNPAQAEAPFDAIASSLQVSKDSTECSAQQMLQDVGESRFLPSTQELHPKNFSNPETIVPFSSFGQSLLPSRFPSSCLDSTRFPFFYPSFNAEYSGRVEAAHYLRHAAWLLSGPSTDQNPAFAFPNGPGWPHSGY